MSPKEWKELKKKLEELGFTVEVVGRARKEYICTYHNMTVDILRGGITYSGSSIEVSVLSDDLAYVVDEENFKTINQVVNYLESYIESYDEFGYISRGRRYEPC